MNNKYKQKISIFMILLIVTFPFYISSVFAQGSFPTVVDPVQSCIDKSDETSDLVDFLDNDAIETLTKIASVLHFTCTAWNTVEIVKDEVMPALGFCADLTCKTGVKFGCLCIGNDATRISLNSLGQVFESICSITECQLCNDGVTEIAGQKIEVLGTDILEFAHLSPFDNIYIATACLCPAAILFNLNKLKTIYQTYDCCVTEACTNGISTESCERQLSEATCMYWEGSLLISLIKILMGLVTSFLGPALGKAVDDIFGDSLAPMIQTIQALFNAYQNIQQLIAAFDWVSETFSEPQCEDLGFGKLREESAGGLSTTFCDIQEIDNDGDGIIDEVVTNCPEI